MRRSRALAGTATTPTKLLRRPTALWDALVRPSPRITGVARRARARALAGVLLGLLPALAVQAGVRFWLEAPPLSALERLALGTLLAVAGLGYVLSRTRYMEAGAAFLVVFGTIGPCIVGYVETAPATAVIELTLSTMGVAFASLFLSLRWSIIAGVFALLAVTLTSMAHPHLAPDARVQAPTAVSFLNLLILTSSAVAQRSVRMITAQARQIRELVERTPFGVAALHDGRVGFANRALFAAIGAPAPALVLGQRFVERIHPEDRGAFEGADANAILVRVVWPDGSRRVLELSRLRRLHFDDRPADLIVTRDITDERDLNEQMLLMERLASLGTIAASVGHEINNPLTFVLFNLDFLRDELRDLLGNTGEPTRAAEALAVLADTRDGAKRASEIVTELKAFGGTADEVMDIDVVGVVRSALRVAATELRHRARVVEHVLPVPTVRGSPARLGQVVLNLLVNAAQAIPPGQAEQHQVSVTTDTDANGAVIITIADTGCGVPEELRLRIFEPFFTTKPPGQGTGLGLAICVKLVRELYGELELESERGAGSTFRLRFPAATGEVAASVEPPSTGLRPIAQGRVLVVEDERPAADAIRRLLVGYFVTVAANGEEALEHCRRRQFDAIVCDLVMPRRAGWELFAALREERPGQEQRMIFVTAGAAMPAAKDFLAGVTNPVLEKPFEPAALKALVRELCGRPVEASPPSGGAARA